MIVLKNILCQLSNLKNTNKEIEKEKFSTRFQKTAQPTLKISLLYDKTPLSVTSLLLKWFSVIVFAQIKEKSKKVKCYLKLKK